MHAAIPLFKRTEKQKEATKIISKYTYSMLVGGSRSGKTFLYVRSIIIRALRKKSKHLIVRFKFNHVKRSIWYNTLPNVLSLCFPGIPFEQNKSDFFIRFSNGSEIWLCGIDGKERTEKILGTDYSTIYINEASQVGYDAFVILCTRLSEDSGLDNRMYLDLNPSTTKQWTYKLFIEGVDPITNEPKNKDLYGHLFMNPTDNRENLPKGYISDILESLPKRQKDRFLHGLYVNEVDGAIWSIDLIDKCRSVYTSWEELKAEEDIITIAMGVDPSTKNKPDSDLCGIVLVASTKDKKYVIDDLSLKASPGVWADKVIWAYHHYGVNVIVVEVNQGGDMVAQILKSKGFMGKIVEVHATNSKFARAEPVEALYEAGVMEHLNTPRLKDLEEEQTSWVPRDSKKSPDRIDALVWATSYFIQGDDTAEKYAKINFNALSKSFRRL